MTTVYCFTVMCSGMSYSKQWLLVCLCLCLPVAAAEGGKCHLWPFIPISYQLSSLSFLSPGCEWLSTWNISVIFLWFNKPNVNCYSIRRAAPDSVSTRAITQSPRWTKKFNYRANRSGDTHIGRAAIQTVRFASSVSCPRTFRQEKLGIKPPTLQLVDKLLNLLSRRRRPVNKTINKQRSAKWQSQHGFNSLAFLCTDDLFIMTRYQEEAVKVHKHASSKTLCRYYSGEPAGKISRENT